MKKAFRIGIKLGVLTLVWLSAINVDAQQQGAVDTTFGNGGVVLHTLNGRAQLDKLVVQADGKVVALGKMTFANITPPPPRDTTVARFNTDGSLDRTFAGDGFTNRPFVKNANAIQLAPDGKILVTGCGGPTGAPANAFRTARLNADGSDDTTFNGSGAISTIIGQDSCANSINLQADGKIVVAGSSTTDSSNANLNDFTMVRYNADGSLDATFGIGGIVTTNISGVNPDIAYVSTIQADGKIVVAGMTVDNTIFQKSLSIVRYNTDGSLDMAFGSGGKVSRVIGGSQTTLPRDIGIQSDGKIIIVGNGLAPLRFNTDGSFNTSFETPSDSIQAGLKIQPDGKILISGSIYSEAFYSFALTRYKTDGMLDQTFGFSGQVITDLSSTAVANAVAILPDGKFIAGGMTTNQLVLARYLNYQRRVTMDFDGNGASNISVFRPSNGVWYTSTNPANNYGAIQFGASTDKIVPADYDGDGKTDVAVYRNGTWYIQRSTAGFTGINFGAADDVPMPADFDGDLKADIVVFRPSNGTWYLLQSQNGFAGVQFGQTGDKPVAADYDADGKADVAVYRNGIWYIQRSLLGFTGIQFGAADDRLVPADYDGDGKTDVAVFRNGTWYIQQSAGGTYGIQFGVATDTPVPAYYDDDSRADLAVWRNGVWYLNQSGAGYQIVTFGAAADTPVPSAFVR